MPRIQPLLPFLRPLGTSSPAAYRQCFRFSTVVRLHDAVPQSNTPSSKPPPPPSTPQAASRAADLAEAESRTEADSAQAPAAEPELPSKHDLGFSSTLPFQSPLYTIQLTKSNNWPVYHDKKRGGNLHITLVRKVDGNLDQLARELQIVLGKSDDEVIIQRAIRGVSVKGHHRDAIVKFLSERGIVPAKIAKKPAL